MFIKTIASEYSIPLEKLNETLNKLLEEYAKFELLYNFVKVSIRPLQDAQLDQSEQFPEDSVTTQGSFLIHPADQTSFR